MSVSNWEQRPFKGRGVTQVRTYESSGVFRDLGNVSVLTGTVNEQVERITNYRTAAGGTAAIQRRVESVEAELTLHDWSKDNLALALLGTIGETAGADVSAEAVTLGQGGLIELAHLGPYTAVAVTAVNGDGASAWQASNTYAEGDYVTPTVVNDWYYKCTTAGDSDATEPATWPTTVGETVSDGTAVWTAMGLVNLVADTDYEAAIMGLRMASTARCTDGEPATVDYTHVGYEAIQALQGGGATLELLMEGVNLMDENKPFGVKLHKVYIGASQALALMSDEAGPLQFTIEVLADNAEEYITFKYPL